jgi:hypothetical protein
MEPAVLYYRLEDPSSLWVITPKGKLKKLYCPFMVICILQFATFQQGMKLYVDEVLVNKQGQLLYDIFGKLYPYYLFAIILQ